MHAIVKYGLLTFLVAAIALLRGVLAGKYAAEASTGFAGNLRDAMYENIQHYSFSNIDKLDVYKRQGPVGGGGGQVQADAHHQPLQPPALQVGAGFGEDAAHLFARCV